MFTYPSIHSFEHLLQPLALGIASGGNNMVYNTFGGTYVKTNK